LALIADWFFEPNLEKLDFLSILAYFFALPEITCQKASDWTLELLICMHMG